jgi:hypothetical protein
MGRPIKYSSSKVNGSLKKGNVVVGVEGGNYGPTSVTGWYNSVNPPAGKSVITQVVNASTPPRFYVPKDDNETIRLAKQLGATGANTGSATSALAWMNSQDGFAVDSGGSLPSIVTDQLSSYVSANAPGSYIPGDTKWYDISGNNLVFNTIGTPLTRTLYGTAYGYTFNGSGYFRCSSNYNLVDLGGDCTLIMWIYGAQAGSRKTIFQKNGTVAQSYEQEIAVTWEVGSSFSYYSRRTPSYDYGGVAATTANAWSMVALKMSTGKTAACRIGYNSKNGSAWAQNYTCRSNTALVAAADIQIGSGYAGTCNAGSGAIGDVLTYNKMLSDAEILQNYNAMKSTYGL